MKRFLVRAPLSFQHAKINPSLPIYKNPAMGFAKIDAVRIQMRLSQIVGAVVAGSDVAARFSRPVLCRQPENILGVVEKGACARHEET